MATRILEFPKRAQTPPQLNVVHRSAMADKQPSKKPAKAEQRLQLVDLGANAPARAYSASQLQALRIVQETRQDARGRASVSPAIINERSPQFWAALPIPERETPFSVTRRLVHMFLASAEIA